MRIEWLNDEMTEAVVTRGVWRWKRRALVKLQPRPKTYDQENAVWAYAISGKDCEYDLVSSLDSCRKSTRKRRQHEQDWQPVSPMPRARVVKT